MAICHAMIVAYVAYIPKDAEKPTDKKCKKFKSTQ